jgi:hypothetical protein
MLATMPRTSWKKCGRTFPAFQIADFIFQTEQGLLRFEIFEIISNPGSGIWNL